MGKVLIGLKEVAVTSTVSDKDLFALSCSDTQAGSSGAVSVRAVSEFIAHFFGKGRKGNRS